MRFGFGLGTMWKWFLGPVSSLMNLSHNPREHQGKFLALGLGRCPSGTFTSRAPGQSPLAWGLGGRPSDTFASLAAGQDLLAWWLDC